ncbi:MAG: hypothetical protein KME35_19260 [Aphanocapsa sp. GSE-SYN-MK-11-07L]|jgi:hypothetical protein|nr:hypothetical protein [Aphanocapsa sp. GSE-SYN-MK-11-07L]
MPLVLLMLVIAVAIALVEAMITVPLGLLDRLSSLPQILTLVGLATAIAWIVGGD